MSEPRWRSTTLWLVTVAALLVLGGAYMAFRTSPASVEESDVVELAGVVRRVVVDVDSGSVSIAGNVRPGALIAREKREPIRKAELSATLADGVLSIRSRCGRPALGCRIDHEIEVPATATLDITTDAGEVTVRNFASSIRVAATAGAVIVERAAGDRLEIHAVAGAVRADALTMRSLVVRCQAGAIEGSFKAVPESVDLATAAGSIDLAVPSAEYRLDLSSAAGRVRFSGVTEVSDAPNAIVAKSQAGNVRVTGI